LELLSIHFALADEFLEPWVIDDSDEEKGRAVGREADGRMNPEEEDGYIRVCGAVDGHQLELVILVAVENGANDLTNLVQSCGSTGTL